MLVTRFVFQVNEMWCQNRIWSNFSGAGYLFNNNNNKKEKKICLVVYVWMDVEGEEEEAEQANQQGGLLHQPAAHWALQHCGGRGEGARSMSFRVGGNLCGWIPCYNLQESFKVLALPPPRPYIF